LTISFDNNAKKMGVMVIHKTIKIDAPLENVWRVFVDASVSRQMGGEYVSDWKAGSSFGWRGSGGAMLTQGMLLEFKEKQLIQHSLFSQEDGKTPLSVITYEFEEKNAVTILSIREELKYETTAGERDDMSLGWDAALKAVKDIAEKVL
jgi:uncharacterized protein YndB with AHSA1/START domain